MILRIYILLILFSFWGQVIGRNDADSLLNMLNQDISDKEKINANYEISRIYFENDLNQAIAFAEQGLKLAIAINDSMQIAQGYYRAGGIYAELGLLDKALERHLQAKTMFEKVGNSESIAMCLNGIASVYWYNNDFATAIDLYREAYKIAVEVKSFLNAAIYMGNVGLCHAGLGNTDSALMYFRKVITLAKFNNYYGNQGWAYNHIAYLNLGQNKIDSASYYYFKALEFRNYLTARLKSYIYLNLTKIYLSENKFDLVAAYVDSVNFYSKQSGSLTSIKDYYEIKFKYEMAIGALDSAIQSQIEISIIKDSILTDDYNSKLTNYQTIFELEKKETVISSLTKENQIIRLKSHQQKTLLILFVIISISSIVIVSLIFRSNKIKQEAIKALNVANQELVYHKKQLISINEELSTQQENLNEKNIELKATIKKLNKTQAQLLQSEKMASIGILSRGVAHELINPLNFVKGGITLLNNYFYEVNNLPDDAQNAIDMMEEGITRSVEIVNQLSQFVAREKEKPQMENLNALIDNSIIFLNFKISSDTIIEKNYAALDESLCYASKFQMVIFQLLNNAIDEINKLKKNKNIRISTEYDSSDRGKFHVVKIYNAGNLIPENIISEIFNPFFTTKDPDKGIGMGLTTAYNILNELKGSIKVENLSSGVEFTIKLPIIKK